MLSLNRFYVVEIALLTFHGFNIGVRLPLLSFAKE